MKKIMYTANIASGEYDDYRENTIFCSENLEQVIKWVDKFNRIISDNRDRIMKSDNYDFFGYSFIKYQDPSAFKGEIPIR